MTRKGVNQIEMRNDPAELTLPLLGGNRGNSGNSHRRNVTTIDQDSTNPYNLVQSIPKMNGTLPIAQPSPLKFRTLSQSKVNNSGLYSNNQSTP